MITGRRDLPSGIDGLACDTNDGPLIIYRRDLSTAESRYAIAHALAQLLYDARAAGSQPVTGDREEHATKLAVELLAPLDLISLRIVSWPSSIGEDREGYADQVDQIASDYHVPPSVIDQRIRWLERDIRS